MKKLKFMTDYFCSPIWHNDGVDFGPICPENLPLSQVLIDDIREWAKIFDDRLNMDDPANSYQWTVKESEWFNLRGQELFERLKSELGSEYSIELGSLS